MRREWVEAIHTDQLREHGGAFGVRDEGLIESALDRARNRWGYGERDIAALAAAYAYGLTKNHGFVDGNKRTAFQTMNVFLGLNGWRLVAPQPEVVRVMIQVAEGRRTQARLATWIRGRLHPR